MSAFQDRRRYPRAKIQWPVIMKTAQGFLTGETRDLSSTGAFVCCQESLSPDEHVSLAIITVPPSKRRLSMSAKVIRSEGCWHDRELTCHGLRFTKISEESLKLISLLVSGNILDEIVVLRTDLESPVRKERGIMQEENRSVELKIEAGAYPKVKLNWQPLDGDQDEVMETEVSFPKELWIDFAHACRQIADDMNAFRSGKLRAGLNVVSQRIMAEIEAEDKRLRNREAYESFAELVAQIVGREDLDKVRKGQLVHDTACRLQLKF